ncbi:MAG: DUF2244 domain-containing protein [Pseudomonadota bacterium]
MLYFPHTVTLMQSAPTNTFLDVSLKPNRSLSPRGFLLVMVVAGLFSLVAGTYFYLKGAWPIMGFFGLDLALLYWALKASYKSALLNERIQLDRAEMTVERTYPNKRRQSWNLHPSWVQVSLEDPEEHHARLSLRDRGTAVELGRFLPPRERAEVADLINDGLERRKQALLR